MPFCHPNENRPGRMCPHELVSGRFGTIVSCFVNWLGLVRKRIFFGDDQMFPMQSKKTSNRTFRQIFIYHLIKKNVTVHYLEVSFMFGVIRYFFTFSTQESVMMVQENDILDAAVLSIISVE